MKAGYVFLIISITAEFQFLTAEALVLKHQGISVANFTRLETIKSSKSGNAYYTSNFVSPWREAIQYCNQVWGTIASIPTGIEDENIRQRLISEALLDRSFWTSGILDKESSSFVWAANGQRFLYTNWESGEPVQHCGNIEICVHIRAEGYMNNQYNWYTENCNSNFHFICVK